MMVFGWDDDDDDDDDSYEEVEEDYWDEEAPLQDKEEFLTKEEQELAKEEREYAEDSALETHCERCGSVVSFGHSMGTHMAYSCDECGNEERDSDGLPEYSDD